VSRAGAVRFFVWRSRIAAPAQRVFDWHKQPDALAKLTPQWGKVEIESRTGQGIEPGTRVVLLMRVGPFRMRWVAEHKDYAEGKMFRDVQISGPSASWVHTHKIEPDGDAACFLEDHIEYALPGGWLGNLIGGWMVRRKLARLFAYRHRVTREENEGSD
jgi:ligand-binding SRPBCC domain-containing protein